MKQPQLIVMRAPTEAEIAEVKAQLKAAKIPASVRIQKNIVRVHGSISIRATKKQGWRFTDEQVTSVIEILDRMGFRYEDYGDNNGICYAPGFWYMLITEKVIKVDAQIGVK